MTYGNVTLQDCALDSSKLDKANLRVAVHVTLRVVHPKVVAWERLGSVCWLHRHNLPSHSVAQMYCHDQLQSSSLL